MMILLQENPAWTNGQKTVDTKSVYGELGREIYEPGIIIKFIPQLYVPSCRTLAINLS